MFVHSFIVGCFVFAIAGACDDGWISHGDMCYLFSHDTEDWSDSYSLCKLIGGQLVEIEDAAKNAYLTTQAALNGRTYFVGLSDIVEEGTWIWTTSKTEVVPGSGYSNWSPHEPSNSGGEENCVTLLSSGLWNDETCHNFRHYICEQQQPERD